MSGSGTCMCQVTPRFLALGDEGGPIYQNEANSRRKDLGGRSRIHFLFTQLTVKYIRGDKMYTFGNGDSQKIAPQRCPCPNFWNCTW